MTPFNGFDSTFLHIAGHGVVGGSANVAMGGKFQDGFISAAVSAGAADIGLINGGVIERTIKAGIIGGTASALGGGKFANGAFTSAFQYLTNEVAAMSREEQITYFENSQGEKLSWLAKLFFKHETIANIAENSSQATMGFADGATGGIHAYGREFIYGDSYSDTGSGYYWTGMAGGVVTSVVATAGASVATSNGAVFGGVSAATAASRASAVGATTLGMTRGGAVATRVADIMIRFRFSPSTIDTVVWKPASALFALNASRIGAYIGRGGPIYNSIEKPILISRATGILSKIIPLSY